MYDAFLDAGSVRIVVTDSGLGGLSVLAELENQISKTNAFKKVELIFFNSLYSKDLGYNEMGSIKEKVNVFNNALFAIQNHYKPDIILIACNTLSVIYSKTKFSDITKIKVEGIVRTGVELYLESLAREPESSIILFGTPTTIDSHVHKDILIKEGIDAKRIINQSCPMLESEIQDYPSSESVVRLINKFVNAARKKVQLKGNKVFAGLCCTHYGYSLNLFERIMVENFGQTVCILNPNNNMVTSLVGHEVKGNNTSLTVNVVSQVEIYEHEKRALSKITNVEVYTKTN